MDRSLCQIVRMTGLCGSMNRRQRTGVNAGRLSDALVLASDDCIVGDDGLCRESVLPTTGSGASVGVDWTVELFKPVILMPLARRRFTDWP